MELQTSKDFEQNSNQQLPGYSRRKFTRFEFIREADWDFFTAGTGAKKGYIENVSQGGCLLRSNELIEHRRWIRMMVKDRELDIWFTAVGRIARREDKMEPWGESDITLYRYGIEFIHALNPLVIEKIKADSSICSICESSPASIPDLNEPKKVYCVLCHLRRACHNLITHEGLKRA